MGGLSQIAEPITWVTASVAYKVTENIQVSLEGRNLLDEFYSSNLGRSAILGGFGNGQSAAGFETWGRSWILGVNAKF